METVQMDMNDERDAGTGQFAQKYDDEEFFNALREHDGAAGTATVADVVGCPQRTAYHHLDRLREEGLVSSQRIGGSMLWLLANESEVEA
jgi:DNA-binding transcriptional ArsR family regulator